MKTWNLGNTTVRNPERIKAGLSLLKENFEGRVFDKEAQASFFEILLEKGLIEGDPSQDRNRAASGRKWQSVCYKLGFVHRSQRVNGVISITEAGNALLSNNVVESDIFLRQLIKVQLPSPTEQRFDGAKIHPFYLVLKVALALYDAGMKPLSKDELGLFMQSAERDDQAQEVVKLIGDYRAMLGSIPGKVGKSRYYLGQRATKAKALKLEESTLEDYGDTTARYSVITGIFTFGGQQSLVIKEDRLNLVRAIVDDGPPPILEGEELLKIFHNPNLPALPTDDADFLKRDIAGLAQRLDELSRQTKTEVSIASEQLVTNDATVLQLRRKREDLEQELIAKKEIQFYRFQCQPDQVENIKSLFESIKARDTIGGSDYRPAWAEWAVWRTFLSINSIAGPISQTRGFKIDTELMPVHTAKGGYADLVFNYADGTSLPVEITLNTGDNQYAAEREPVRRHALRLIESGEAQKVVGVFVAPTIQPRTAHDFYAAHSSGDYSAKLGVISLDIIPITIDQLCQLMPGQPMGCRNYDELYKKLSDILALREASKDGNEWLDKINSYFLGRV